jgi:hypothetical protein
VIAETLTVTAPDGYVVRGPASRTVTITAAGEDVVDQDFVLTPVTLPVSGSVTDDAGTYGLELPPGRNYITRAAFPRPG